MFGNVCSLTSHWHVFVPFDFNHESLSRCEGGRQMMWCFLDYVLYNCHVLYNYHSCFVMLFCFCTFLHVIYLVFLLKIVSSRVILRKQQGVRESQSGPCCSAVFDFWPLPWCIDPCLQGIRTDFWFRSSPHRKSNRTQEPPEFYFFTTFSVKPLEILFNSNSQCTNKSSAMWNQSSWFICSHCACKTENKVARRHFPQCKIHL